MLKRTLLATVLLASTSAVALADPILGIQLTEVGFGTFTVTSNNDPLIVSQPFGTFDTNIEINNIVLNPLSLDLASINTSTAAGGNLTITASASGLTSPEGLANFVSQFSGNFGGSVASVSGATYVNNDNELFGTDTLLASFGPIGTSPFGTALSIPTQFVLDDEFSLTAVINIVATGVSNFSLDESISVTPCISGTPGCVVNPPLPEPGSLALLGSGLTILGLAYNRRRRTNASLGTAT